MLSTLLSGSLSELLEDVLSEDVLLETEAVEELVLEDAELVET